MNTQIDAQDFETLLEAALHLEQRAWAVCYNAESIHPDDLAKFRGLPECIERLRITQADFKNKVDPIMDKRAEVKS